MNFPNNLYYTREHEWINFEGGDGLATIGITDFAQRELGDIVFVEINAKGRELAQNDTFGAIEAVKTVSDMFIPVAGTVTEGNPALANNPELVNNDCYGEGWIAKMQVKNASDKSGLLTASEYEAIL